MTWIGHLACEHWVKCKSLAQKGKKKSDAHQRGALLVTRKKACVLNKYQALENSLIFVFALQPAPFKYAPVLEGKNWERKSSNRQRAIKVCLFLLISFRKVSHKAFILPQLFIFHSVSAQPQVRRRRRTKKIKYDNSSNDCSSLPK